MWADWEVNPWRHYYINELAQTLDGSYVMLQRWIMADKQMEVEIYPVNHNVVWVPFLWLRPSANLSQVDSFIVCHGPVKRMHAKDLRRSILDILGTFPSICFQSMPSSFLQHQVLTITDWNFPFTHPLRDKADGRPVFNIRLSVWTDDVSGNTSKQYNPHMNMYLANQNIPHKYLVQEYFVRFVSTSPHASSSELFQGLQKYM
jgi:hypothetical protein